MWLSEVVIGRRPDKVLVTHWGSYSGFENAFSCINKIVTSPLFLTHSFWA